MIGYGTGPRSLGKQIRSWRGRMAATPEKHRPIFGRSSAMRGEHVLFHSEYRANEKPVILHMVFYST